MILSAIHHYCAPTIYQSPWRLHVVQVSIVVIIYSLWYLLFAANGKILYLQKLISIFLVVTGVVSVAWIDIFEGGYNYFVKNIVFLIGVSEI